MSQDFASGAWDPEGTPTEMCWEIEQSMGPLDLSMATRFQLMAQRSTVHGELVSDATAASGGVSSRAGRV